MFKQIQTQVNHTRKEKSQTSRNSKLTSSQSKNTAIFHEITKFKELLRKLKALKC